MTIELSHDETQQLLELLHDYLPQLKREVARTEVHTLQHAMARRQDFCEHLLARLEAIHA